jgi:hypothetical protein
VQKSALDFIHNRLNIDAIRLRLAASLCGARYVSFRRRGRACRWYRGAWGRLRHGPDGRHGRHPRKRYRGWRAGQYEQLAQTHARLG